MHRTLARLAILLLTSLGLVAGGLASVTGAAAHHGGQGKGLTRVAIAPPVVKLVTSAGIAVSPVGAAHLIKFRGTVALKFPISDVVGNGTRIKHTGGVKLSTHDSEVVLKRFRINTSRGIVSANFNNSARVDVFRLAGSKSDLGKVKLRLTKTAAKALNQAFAPGAFSGGDTFGYATVFAK
jgi:hypothetical protein